MNEYKEIPDDVPLEDMESAKRKVAQAVGLIESAIEDVASDEYRSDVHDSLTEALAPAMQANSALNGQCEIRADERLDNE